MTTASINRFNQLIGTKVTGDGSKTKDGRPVFQDLLQKSNPTESRQLPEKKPISQEEVRPLQKQENSEAEKVSNQETPKTGQNSSEEKKPLESRDIPDKERQALQELVEKVQIALDISAEEMQMWLSTLGMNFQDLFQTGQLQQFFLQVKGIDVSGLLTDSESSGQLKELLTELGPLEKKVTEMTEQLPADFDWQEALSQSQTKAEPEKNLISEQPKVQDFLSQMTEKEEAPIQKEMPKTVEISQAQLPDSFQKVLFTKQELVVTAGGLEKTMTTISARDIMEQVVTKFTAQTLQDTAKITVQLNPEHLGKLAFQVVSRGGQMTGQFVTENEAVKTALEAQMTQLKEHLAEQGIKVNEVKVVVGDTLNYFAEERNKDQDESSKRRNKKMVLEFEPDVAKEPEDSPEIVSETATVNFMA